MQILSAICAHALPASDLKLIPASNDNAFAHSLKTIEFMDSTRYRIFGKKNAVSHHFYVTNDLRRMRREFEIVKFF
ncbi:hypothetical protein EVAR_16320_1 [Eumeta japonica]|uniref:Uncharacterized protein n=1 Tax=Eumeta variegata TaxID=151549 RepID=A0A4C1VI72_EUMVA|nr:hypothetical protein EVAR_16320_1 [Eumeta japonica]